MQARIAESNANETFSLMGIDVLVRARGEDTGGALSALEQRVAPGAGSPLHTIPQDKIIMVLDGAVTLVVGDEQRAERAGGTAFIPRGVRHCFRNASDAPARILVLTLPGGHEDMLRSLSQELRGQRPAPGQMARFGERHGVQFF